MIMHAHAHAYARPHAADAIPLSKRSAVSACADFPWQMGSTWRARNIHPARAYPMRDSPGNLPIAARISPALRERESKVCRLSAGEVNGDYSNGNPSTTITACSVYASCTHTANQSSSSLPPPLPLSTPPTRILFHLALSLPGVHVLRPANGPGLRLASD